MEAITERRDSIDDFVGIQEFVNALIRISEDNATLIILIDLQKKLEDYYGFHFKPVMDAHDE